MAQWWEEWQLRILVLASLSAQYFLVLSSRARKFHLPSWLKVSFRLVHLGSDALAIAALTTLFNRQKGGPRCSYARGTRDLELLWAPILVMHLGGQVVITSYKIEDNEQWSRHILTSLSKVTVALYVFYKSWSSDDKKLLAATILLFILVIIRSFQKALNLKGSSFNALRKASSLPEWVTVRTTDGQRKWSEGISLTIREYVSQARASVEPQFVADLEAAGVPQPGMKPNQELEANTVLPRLPYQLFLDFSCGYVDRFLIMQHFWSLDRKSTCLTIESTLSAMTSFLYTKDDRTTRHDFKNVTLLLILRRWTKVLATYATLIAAICLVHKGSHKEAYSGEDTWVTFVLLYGTLLLELVYIGIRSALQGKFSGQILQHNLIGLVAHNKCHSKLTYIAACLGCKELVDQYFWHMKPNYSSCEEITDLVRCHVETGWKDIFDPSSYRKFNDSRGDWTLAKYGCLGLGELGWSITGPFDESIILWHLATDLCFHKSTHDRVQPARRCKEISNYMMHLLFENPEMLMPGSRRNLLRRVCCEVHKIIKNEETPRDEREMTCRILDILSRLTPRHIDESVIGDACLLAQQLLCNEETKMWKVIEGVWVEMLCFSAGRSRGYLHAEALGTGVEYLSYIWILLAYTGMETFSDKLQRSEWP